MASERLRAFPGLYLERDGEAEGSDVPDGIDRVPFPLRPPETIERDMQRLGSIVRDGLTTTILCDNPGQAERLDELLAGTGGAGASPSPAGIAVGVLGGGFVIPPQGPDRSTGLRVLTDHEIFRQIGRAHV